VVDPGPGSGSVDPDPTGTDDPADDSGDTSDDPDPSDSANPHGNDNSHGNGTRHSGSRAANAVPPAVPPQTVGVSAAGVATVKIVCPPDSGGCSGTVVIDIPQAASGKSRGKGTLAKAAARRPAALRIGKAKFNAKAGTSPVVPVRLSKRGRQRIIRRHRSKARITVTTRSATGGSVVTTQEVTIRPKRSVARRRGHKSRP
jgi:hypothetical protein